MLEIYQGFRTALTALPDAPPIAYLNQSFDSDGLYLRESFNPAEVQDPTIDDNGHQIKTGFYAVNVMSPLEEGFYPVQLIGDTIVNHFFKGRIIGGAKVTKAWVSPSFTTEEHFVMPVTIRFRKVT